MNNKKMVKFCQFSSKQEVLDAERAGADFLGFHCFSFQDKDVKISLYNEIKSNKCQNVLLTDFSVKELIVFLTTCPMHAVQLYSEYTQKDLNELKNQFPDLKIFYVYSLKLEENKKTIQEIFKIKNIDYLLLDSHKIGGSGKVGDWMAASEIVKRSPIPVFLAGGLTSSNIVEARDVVNPAGFDVQTGVSINKVKSLELMTELIKKILA